jgi:hypothetical protein
VVNLSVELDYIFLCLRLYITSMSSELSSVLPLVMFILIGPHVRHFSDEH